MLSAARSRLAKDVAILPETVAISNLFSRLSSDFSNYEIPSNHLSSNGSSEVLATDPKAYYDKAVLSSLLTLSCHVHSRVASLCGKGFYTIGPCGEEGLAPLGIESVGLGGASEGRDTVAWHYRHLSPAIGRAIDQQLSEGASVEDAIRQIALDRARGYTLSPLDPVTGGTHCSLGGSGPGDFLTTSTLASQCTPAVGRALGQGVWRQIVKDGGFDGTGLENDIMVKPHRRGIHLVTIGDGSATNGHFLSAVTLATQAQHNGVKCPVLFGVSVNNISISYPMNNFFEDSMLRNACGGIANFRCNGNDVVDVAETSKMAIDFVRREQKPAVLVMGNLTRRFGHAATDRQSAYRNQRDINADYEDCVVSSIIKRGVREGYVDGGVKRTEELARFVHSEVERAFDAASEEREEELERRKSVEASSINADSFCAANTYKGYEVGLAEGRRMMEEKKGAVDGDGMSDAPVIFVERLEYPSVGKATDLASKKKRVKGDVMRKNMNKALDESLSLKDRYPLVYIGEDVRHGGYYLVTDGLYESHGPSRVIDFAPDETSLLGAGIGFSQSGNTVPVVEIPYAKYLDCGADIFQELLVQNWLIKGSKQRGNGVIIRLQGFDKGTFGGNFHTHNSLPFCGSSTPGLTVVAYSNGKDWVRGWRGCVEYARKGGVVMVVDCTDLLNERHLLTKGDRLWEKSFVPRGGDDDTMRFDDVTVYKYEEDDDSEEDGNDGAHGRIAIVSYGNGVLTALRARNTIALRKATSALNPRKIDVIDLPLLSRVSTGLRKELPKYSKVVFADICKGGGGSGGPLSGIITELQKSGDLPANWNLCNAAPTYNPLGDLSTFLNERDIIESLKSSTIANKRT